MKLIITKLCIATVLLTSAVLIYLRITKAMSGSIIVRPMIDNATDIDLHNDTQIIEYNSGCECIKYDCGCCQVIRLDQFYLDGTLCLNASYLEFDYGISITMTYNNFTILNETVSAGNPPPICVGEDIVDGLEIEVCLLIFDINIIHDKFHACFEILARFMKFKLVAIKLGCVNTKYENMKYYVEDNAIHSYHSWLQLFREKQKNSSSFF